MRKIALVGNPNTGKTSLFNYLTGSYEYVGNWSGVTVEKKVGTLKNKAGLLVDLPGIYTFNPLSKDESVVSNYFLSVDFEGVINIVDASQLERNLNLTIQLLEFGKPMLIGLNMSDVAKQRGIIVDVEKLSEAIQIPVISIVARTGEGCDLITEHISNIEHTKQPAFKLDYGQVLENGIEKLVALLSKNATVQLPPRWLALQFFEGNQAVHRFLETLVSEEELKTLYIHVENQVKDTHHVRTLSQWIYSVRRLYISSVLEQAIEKKHSDKIPLTDRIDAIVTNKYLGIPIFLLCMYLMFKITFDWLGTPLSDLVDAFISGPLSEWLSILLLSLGTSEFIQSLVLDGIVAGVGGVIVFVPQIFILFFFISLLEDSGYMSRAALVMDKLMESVGLNGKAFIPMIIGFGCNVPGVMAARTIEQPKERLITMLLTPLMSCSARLPVYTLFVGAFFNQYQTIIVFSLYVLGIILALLLAQLFSKTLLKDEKSVFVVELPAYHIPQAKSLLRSTWDKGKGFIRKAGTLIFGGSVLIWLLSYAGPGGINVKLDDSFLAIIGGVLSPVFAPVGFGNWQAGASLLTGFIAKELVVSSMNIIYHAPDLTSLQGTLTEAYTPLAAFSFIVFILLYVPCIATVGTIKKETGSTKWTYFAVFYSLVLAYVITLIIYQGGKLLGY